MYVSHRVGKQAELNIGESENFIKMVEGHIGNTYQSLKCMYPHPCILQLHTLALYIAK